MNAALKDLPAKLRPLLDLARKYLVFTFAIGLLLVFGYLIFQITSYTQREPSEDAVTEKLTQVKRPKVDEAAIEKIEQLQDQNIEVQTIFKQARDNPFSE